MLFEVFCYLPPFIVRNYRQTSQAANQIALKFGIANVYVCYGFKCNSNDSRKQPKGLKNYKYYLL
jgi:hypothetical protein